MICQYYFGLFCFHEIVAVVRCGILCQRRSPLMIFTVYVWATWMFNLSIFFLTSSWSRINRENMNYLNPSVSHTLNRKPTFHHLRRHNSLWSCCQTILPQLKRQPRPERFVPHRIKPVMGHWNTQAVKSNEATRLPLELCLSDPPPVQIIMSDSQTRSQALKCD